MLSFNHVFKFGATALAAFVLSACGSSGGGGDNQDSSPVNNHELNQSNTLVNLSLIHIFLIMNPVSGLYLHFLVLIYK